MSCDNLKILLSAYVDEEVDETERVMIESHLATCESCSVELDKLNRLKALFHFLEVKEPAIGFRGRLSARLTVVQDRKPFWNRLKIWSLDPFPRSLTYAFLFIFLIATSSFIFLELQSSQEGSEYQTAEAPKVAVLEQQPKQKDREVEMEDRKVEMARESNLAPLRSESVKSLVPEDREQPARIEELYAEDILFEYAWNSEGREDLLSFSLDTDPFEDLFEGVDLGG